MNDLTYLFAIAGALAAVLASISIWSRKALAVKVVALVATTAFLPTAYASLTHLLGRPKPVALEWMNRAGQEVTVLSTQLIEDKAIYLWIRLPDSDVPFSYGLPWNEQMARQIRDAEKAAERDGTQVKSRIPFAKLSDESERMFYSEPRLPPPPKADANQPDPILFKGSNSASNGG